MIAYVLSRDNDGEVVGVYSTQALAERAKQLSPQSVSIRITSHYVDDYFNDEDDWDYDTVWDGCDDCPLREDCDMCDDWDDFDEDEDDDDEDEDDDDFLYHEWTPVEDDD